MALPSVLIALTSGNAKGQKIPDPRPFANAITAQDLKAHLYIVAGKDFEGRETGTEGQRKAAAYIENDFKSLGLQPGNKGSYQLYYPIFQDSLTAATIRINEQDFRLNEDFAVNTAANYSATLMGSEIVFAGYGISDSTRDDYKGLDVKGKIVLILNAPPSGSTPAPTIRRSGGFHSRKDLPQKNGAVAPLVIPNGCPPQSCGDTASIQL